MPTSPAPALAPPPEGIYRSFEDLLTAVQRVAKDQGYGVVKLRSSNYREGKPTRFDLVCDRGGVKYSSTAKKRNPSTRKVDCPWRGKAVCEVQLGNQWRFVVQEARHNHEPRVPTAPPGQENTPVAQSIRSLTNKIDRMTHEMTQGFTRLESRLESMEKRIESFEQSQQSQLSQQNQQTQQNQQNHHNHMIQNRVPMMSAPPGILDGRMNQMEARMEAIERGGMEMQLGDMDATTRLLTGSTM